MTFPFCSSPAALATTGLHNKLGLVPLSGFPRMEGLPDQFPWGYAEKTCLRSVRSPPWIAINQFRLITNAGTPPGVLVAGEAALAISCVWRSTISLAFRAAPSRPYSLSV
jgi:hypothetical protein